MNYWADCRTPKVNTTLQRGEIQNTIPEKSKWSKQKKYVILKCHSFCFKFNLVWLHALKEWQIQIFFLSRTSIVILYFLYFVPAKGYLSNIKFSRFFVLVAHFSVCDLKERSKASGYWMLSPTFWANLSLFICPSVAYTQCRRCSSGCSGQQRKVSEQMARKILHACTVEFIILL